MAEPEENLIAHLRRVLSNLKQSPFRHIPNPEGCKKRASVALILRVRPAYSPQRDPLDQETTELGNSREALDNFFAQPWVQKGDPEVLFIKRAGRVGDRWSGHVALPGGGRDPVDASDLDAAIRETMEEVGLDLSSANCLHTGNLAERVVTTAWSKESLMVLCPYIFLMTSKTIPPLALQPTEVAAAHWVPLRALLSSALRTREFVDISSRFARRRGSIVHKLLRLTLGKMMFSAVQLIPSESLFASSTPGFIPEEKGGTPSAISEIARLEFGFSSISSASNQPLLLWGLTLGVLADFLDMLPPHNAVHLWHYPSFTHLDLHIILYLLTYRIRKNNAASLSTGTYPNQTAVDATTQAVVVSEAEPRRLSIFKVGMGGLGIGPNPSLRAATLLRGYYDRVSLAVGVVLGLRAVFGSIAVIWLFRKLRKAH